jgi:hypothetical protein
MSIFKNNEFLHEPVIGRVLFLQGSANRLRLYQGHGIVDLLGDAKHSRIIETCLGGSRGEIFKVRG